MTVSRVRFLFWRESRGFCERGFLVFAVQLQHCGRLCGTGAVCGGTNMSVRHHSQCARWERIVRIVHCSRWPFSSFSFFSFSSGAVLYISFVNATESNGCEFFEDLLPAIKIMKPLASLFAAVEGIEDFGLNFFEPYGNFSSYQHSGLSLTMVNVPAWRRVEEILSSEVNVTASMTPCKNTMFSPSKHSAVSHELRLLPHLDVGNYIVYAHSPAFKAYQGVFISAYVSHFLLFLFFLSDFFFLNNSTLHLEILAGNLFDLRSRTTGSKSCQKGTWVVDFDSHSCFRWTLLSVQNFGNCHRSRKLFGHPVSWCSSVSLLAGNVLVS